MPPPRSRVVRSPRERIQSSRSRGERTTLLTGRAPPGRSIMSRGIPTVVASCALTCLALAARPAAADEADKYFKLVHADTGKVLAIEDSSEEAGARAVLAKDDGS